MVTIPDLASLDYSSYEALVLFWTTTVFWDLTQLTIFLGNQKCLKTYRTKYLLLK